jgi:hypothetical protein
MNGWTLLLGGKRLKSLELLLEKRRSSLTIFFSLSWNINIGIVVSDKELRAKWFHNCELISNGTNWYDIVVEPANKLTYLAIKAQNIVKTKKSIGRIKPSFHYLEKDSMMIPFYIQLPMFLPYSATFVQRIDEFISNGLVKKFTDDCWPKEERFDEEVELQVLSVYQLRLGFVAFLIYLAFSAGAFIVEITVKSVLSLMSRHRKVKPLKQVQNKIICNKSQREHIRILRKAPGTLVWNSYY